MLFDKWTLPEFEYLQDNEWVFTEKVDGTNIRVMFDGELKYNGKTDRAQLPVDLIEKLHEIFDPHLEYFKESFVPPKDVPVEVCLYGEGYGAGIQKGGCYRQDKSFVLFDIKIGNMWLQREDVRDIAEKLEIDIVPIIGRGTLMEGVNLVKEGIQSTWGDFIAEGIVARPAVEMRTRRGERLITKIKTKDFK